MAKIKELAFAVTVTGVGRKDYSQDVQYSVEPIIRSYQQSFILDNVYTVNALSTRTINVTIPASTVVLLYDFLASQTTPNSILGMQVLAVDTAGVASSIFSKFGNEYVEHHHSRGAPVFQRIRIVLTNTTVAQMTIYVTIAGILTGVQEYFQRLAS